MVDMSKEEGGQEVDMSKEEGGQEVDVMSKEKEKGGEEHEELSIMEEEEYCASHSNCKDASSRGEKEKSGKSHLTLVADKEGEGRMKDQVEFLKEGFLEIFGLDTTEWPIVVPTPCPQQGAGDDCALFVCKYMECLSKKNIIGLSFSQADMDLIRGKLAWAIIEEVNREKAHKSSGEEAVEKIVSLLDET
ncbi:hypothetical protein Taro_032715 [Colocasia esculenta]|uniref:Ubiquitin-like protease family profile domain-containing protein n=1 Tax=Colocasia esculenta TaxID=4460 RepID=A0A843W6X5_COLES|nr:hypothetical protein [Colocasia esculenta]